MVMFNKLNPMQCQQTAVKVEEEAAHISVVDFASSVGLVLRYHLPLIHNTTRSSHQSAPRQSIQHSRHYCESEKNSCEPRSTACIIMPWYRSVRQK